MLLNVVNIYNPDNCEQSISAFVVVLKSVALFKFYFVFITFFL